MFHQFVFIIVLLWWPCQSFSQPPKYRANQAKVILTAQVETLAVQGLSHNGTSVLNIETGQLLFVVPVQSFQFQSRIVQKYFNYPGFTYSKKFPHFKFKGQVVNFANLETKKNIPQSIVIKGRLTVRGVTHPIEATGILTRVNHQKLQATAQLIVPDVFSFGIGKQEDTRFLRGTQLKITIEATYYKQARE